MVLMMKSGAARIPWWLEEFKRQAPDLQVRVWPDVGDKKDVEFAFVWAPAWRLALPLLAVTIFLNYFYLSAMVTLVQEQVRADQRVMSGALLLLVMNFIGLGLGPTYVGSISQFFRATHPQNSLQIALYALTPFYLVAVFLFLMLARVLRKESAASGETAP